MKPARLVSALLAAVAAAVAFWWLLGREHVVPGALADGQRLQCASYTPFVGEQTPAEFHVDRARLERDFALLSPQVACVRIYSVRGMELIPEVAREHGMRVIAGAWIGRENSETEREIAGVIELANRYPDVIDAVLVGNEVLLRRERTAAQLLAYMQRVRAAVSQPVSYGDVWEFWLQNPSIVAGADFVTIHLLPYWENDPSDIDGAIAAVERARKKTEQAFPGKDILIGETGWPSQGRQREGAVPSRVNEARFVRGFVARAEAEGWHYNLIEAFDQPWKRAQEGAVGGYWGLFDTARQDKHIMHGTVSNLPEWRSCLAAGLALWSALVIVTAAWRAPGAVLLAALGANGVVFHLQQMRLFSRAPAESAWFLLLAAAALGASWIGCRRLQGRPPAPWHAALIGTGAALVAIEMLGLAFDARYRHFPLAVFAAPAVVAWLYARSDGSWRERNRVLGWLLLLCIPPVLWQETPLNLQAMGWIALSALTAAGLLRSGAAQSRANTRSSASASSAITTAGAP